MQLYHSFAFLTILGHVASDSNVNLIKSSRVDGSEEDCSLGACTSPDMASLLQRKGHAISKSTRDDRQLSTSSQLSSANDWICIPDLLPNFEIAFSMMAIGMVFVAVSALTLASIPAQSSPAAVAEGDGVPTPQVPMLRIHSLDGLRIVVVVSIVLFHMGTFPEDASVIIHGSVDLLFILSGFLACSAEIGRRDSYHSRSAASFIARKMARLCPAYYAALLWSTCDPAYHEVHDSRAPYFAWPMDTIFVQSLFPFDTCGSGLFVPWLGNYVAWFASALLLSFLCFPFFYNVRPRSGLQLVAHATILATTYTTVWILLENNPSLQQRGLGGTFFCFPIKLMVFIAGMLSAQVFDKCPLRVRRWDRWGWVFDGSLLLAFVLRRHFAFDHENKVDTLVLLAFCVTCVAARGAIEQPDGTEAELDKPNSGLICRILASRPILCLAPYAYGMYIFQSPVQKGIYKLQAVLTIPEPLLKLQPCLCLLSVVVVAIAFEHLVEVRIRSLVEGRIRNAGNMKV
eukprot:gnl/TRDRNA2_/TRDRNA2_43229_c0_seq1.p1 gnl/TRDRNA2_/TRDRNA2_43229_c0~~gnl/TRDRNA2_/TRDRNA2_43229_c0_seq1.p1  ORF type:complete len:514 (-),score=36.30 gnl/TRDRNA2_/TRDRNA2_43229_c0_seq1:159-1700(-)